MRFLSVCLMSDNECTAEGFLRDIGIHKMTVKRDDGIYSHLSFRQAAPASWNMWFDLVTWPGVLTLHGDMGTWTFSRVDDMFTFFRSDDLKINASYWQEKVQSESRFGGPSRRFKPEAYKASVLWSLDNYELSDQQKIEVIAALEEEVFNEEDETVARRALSDFEHEGFRFSDPWEIDGHGYTYHFLWCLYAIVWGIQQYDAQRPNLTAAALGDVTSQPEAGSTRSAS